MVWTVMGNIRGPEGPAGPPGADGSGALLDTEDSTDRAVVNNNGAQVTIFEHVVPAGTLSVGDLLEGGFLEALLNSSGAAATIQFRLLLNGDTIFSGPQTSLATNVNPRRVVGRFEFIIVSGGWAMCGMEATVSNAVPDTGALVGDQVRLAGVIARMFNPAIDNTITVTAQWGTSNVNIEHRPHGGWLKHLVA